MTSKRKSSQRYYRSIENLPQWNFQKVLQTGDLRFILVLDDYFEIESVKVNKSIDLNTIWEKIFDEYIKEFGLSDSYMRVMRDRRRIALLKCDMIIRGDYGLEAAIRIQEKKLDDEGNKTEISFEETVAHVEKYRGMAIDVTKVSVKRFNTYLKMMRK